MRVVVQLSALEPALGLAVDEALLESVHRHGTPVLRFWMNQRSVIVGRSQRIEDEVDEAAATALGYAVARRMSGGGAVVHGPGNLNVTYVGQKDAGTRSVHDVFECFGRAIVAGLRPFGLEVQRVGNSLFLDGGKISGAAQVHRGNSVLYHATLLRMLPEHPMERLLLALRTSYHPRGGVPSRPEPVTSLAHQLGTAPSAETLIDALTDAFATAVGTQATRDGLAEEESARAEELANTRYRRDTWTRCL